MLSRWMLFSLLMFAAVAAAAQTTHTSATHKPQSPCHAITNAMLRGPLALTEPCYSVDIFATVDNAIRVSPGTRIVFGAHSALAINQNGSLEAVGTPEMPIIFQGRDHTAGFWNGLNIGTNSSHNRLSYVTVEDGGTTGTDSGAILLTPGAQLALDHTTVRNSAGNGLRLMQRGVLSKFEANRFENTDIPVYLKASDVSMIDAATTFANNKTNVVFVQFGDATVTDDAVWRDIAVPYRMDGGVDIRAHLEIEPGTRLEFKANVPFNITPDGSLTAIGTPHKPIVFTGTDDSSGYWAGIDVLSHSNKNILRHVDIRFGGSNSGAVAGCVGVNTNASVDVQSSTISGCPVAILVRGSGSLNSDAATSNTFRDDGKNVAAVR